VKATRKELEAVAQVRTAIALQALSLQRAVDEANRAVSAALDRLNRTVAAYNGTVTDGRAAVKAVADRLRDEWDEKSEKWQEGEAGQAAESFVTEWEEAMDATDTLALVVLPDILVSDIVDGKWAHEILGELPEESDQ
jgi:hypothetical protein